MSALADLTEMTEGAGGQIVGGFLRFDEQGEAAIRAHHLAGRRRTPDRHLPRAEARNPFDLSDDVRSVKTAPCALHPIIIIIEIPGRVEE